MIKLVDSHGVRVVCGWEPEQARPTKSEWVAYPFVVKYIQVLLFRHVTSWRAVRGSVASQHPRRKMSLPESTGSRARMPIYKYINLDNGSSCGMFGIGWVHLDQLGCTRTFGRSHELEYYGTSKLFIVLKAL